MLETACSTLNKKQIVKSRNLPFNALFVIVVVIVSIVISNIMSVISFVVIIIVTGGGSLVFYLGRIRHLETVRGATRRL